MHGVQDHIRQKTGPFPAQQPGKGLYFFTAVPVHGLFLRDDHDVLVLRQSALQENGDIIDALHGPPVIFPGGLPDHIVITAFGIGLSVEGGGLGHIAGGLFGKFFDVLKLLLIFRRHLDVV